LLSHEGLFLNSVGDVNLLPLVLKAAENRGKRPSQKQMDDFKEKAGLVSIFGI